jgi:transposase-like protein
LWALVGNPVHRTEFSSSSLPNEDSIVRLIGAVLLEANDEWQLQHRYMQIEGMA